MDNTAKTEIKVLKTIESISFQIDTLRKKLSIVILNYPKAEPDKPIKQETELQSKLDDVYRQITSLVEDIDI